MDYGAFAREKGLPMRRSIVGLLVAALGVGFGVASASASVIIGNVSQSNSQAVNSSQSASNGDGGSGSTFILGNSTPTLIQSSVNVLSNSQSIGAPAPCTIPYCPAATTNFTLIGNASQVNNQAVNSQQVGSNGSGGGGLLFIGGNSGSLLDQFSLNLLFNDIILG
jgi:hypothetical protein